MNDQLIEIGARLRALREDCELSAHTMAGKLDVSPDEYEAYERGENDFSFSFLYNAAKVLGVDVLDIMSGDTPKLKTACIVRAGEGYSVNRREAYEYKHLAFTFKDKLAEPFMVTVQPEDHNTTAELHGHEGQELNYMVEGELELYIGEMSYVLHEGDSIYFDSREPHGMRALGGKPAKFLAVVIKGE